LCVASFDRAALGYARFRKQLGAPPVFRPINEDDLDLVTLCDRNDPVSVIDAVRFRHELAEHKYRLPWSWILEANGRLLARALWWGPSGSQFPVALDCLWVEASDEHPEAAAAGLLNAGHAALLAAGTPTLPDFNIDVATNWRADPAAVTAITWRSAAAAAAGLTERIERLRFEWTVGTPKPDRSTRLTFATATDKQFMALFGEVAQGSLDIHTRRKLETLSPAEQASDDLDFYLGLPGNRDDWRVARDATGALVGFAIPSRSAYHPSVSYLGVLPRFRGRGFVDDLLAEITHIHVEAGAEQITGTTDTTNAPMAAAFGRAGYRNTACRIVLSAPSN
jgi:ribosomal protein S18 acetylase RimI-like enzyme